MTTLTKKLKLCFNKKLNRVTIRLYARITSLISNTFFLSVIKNNNIIKKKVEELEQKPTNVGITEVIYNCCEKGLDFVINHPFLIIGTTLGVCSVFIFGNEISTRLTFIGVESGNYIDNFLKKRYFYRDPRTSLRVPRKSDFEIETLEEHYYYVLNLLFEFKETYCNNTLSPAVISTLTLEQLYELSRILVDLENASEELILSIQRIMATELNITDLDNIYYSTFFNLALGTDDGVITHNRYLLVAVEQQILLLTPNYLNFDNLFYFYFIPLNIIVLLLIILLLVLLVNKIKNKKLLNIFNAVPLNSKNEELKLTVLIQKEESSEFIKFLEEPGKYITSNPGPVVATVIGLGTTAAL